ncbi:hypothetical protein [Acetonema longum]|uniref:Uncharacterized protein n=1 Tax=Acetonema longum DSM 6540 TaxID=1009370 RepID=F7NIM3_9FIRM|nr:hypothetical protein [Acetonema longum]EGO64087.1 hypothetical protein ALO_09629 [Acetonema longum DSM 6540]
MKNVYDKVSYFFSHELGGNLVITQEWVEGFLRQKAWQGSTDKELSEIWDQLQLLIQYLAVTEHETLEEISGPEYSIFIEWAGHATSFKITLQSVRRIFGVLEEFFQYLIGRRLLHTAEDLQLAAKEIAGGKRLRLLKHHLDDDELERLKHEWTHSLGPRTAMMLDDEASIFADIVERLMNKLAGYFQKNVFDEDFHRALFLYVGPANTIPSPHQENFEEFWMGFWDYFLFDYHLIADDRSPVDHFCQSQEKLSGEERAVLRDLVQAEFSVFYINKIVNQDWVECVNLFTDEVFEMPYPAVDNKMMKRLLFFGHIFSHGTIMANYVASVDISPNLRRRIKQEISRQREIFTVQQPDASWKEFFRRHSIAVRHTMHVLTTVSTVNVTPLHARQQYPSVEKKREPQPAVVEVLQRMMPKYGFSLHDIRLAEKMWSDYCQRRETQVRKPAVWAAAVVYTFSLLNSLFNASMEELAQDAGISTSGIYASRGKIEDILELDVHDARYLNEEGFLLLLYMS